MSFPQELKERKQWVCWRLEPDKDGGKPKKMPINPVTGKGAMSNNPKTWTDYQTAFDAYEKYGYTGIGYMFTKDDGYVGVDIDHCYDPETDEFNEVAKAIIARKPTYVEFSPSGDGIHLYFKGSKPSGSSKNTENGVEMAFNRILSSEEKLSDFGRTLLNTSLKIAPADAEKWYAEGKDKFNADLPSRIVSNLACCYAGLRLLEKVCIEYSLAFDAVFPFGMDICTKYMEFAAKDYLLDGGTNNQSIVEQTFEIMARMKLDPKVYYKIDGGRLYLWLTPVYDLYTRYRKDYAIVGEVLTYAQFKKQLQYSEYFIASNEQKRIGTDNHKCWVMDYELLRKNCDISGFEVIEIEPLTT